MGKYAIIETNTFFDIIELTPEYTEAALEKDLHHKNQTAINKSGIWEIFEGTFQEGLNRVFEIENIQEAEATVKTFLAAQNAHLAAHEYGENSYCYINSNDHDYKGEVSTPETIEEAFRYGHLWISKNGIEGLGETIPLSFDFVKIRRRVEDALRKTCSQEKIIECALALNVKLA